jgi:hypothetical protein
MELEWGDDIGETNGSEYGRYIGPLINDLPFWSGISAKLPFYVLKLWGLDLHILEVLEDDDRS